VYRDSLRRTVVLAIITSLGAASASGCGPKPCPMPARSGWPGAPMLWRVQRAGGDGPVVWLYGTIHNASKSEIAAPAWKALDASPRFVSELGALEPDPDMLREMMRLPRGKGLDQRLPRDAWWDLREALDGVIREDDLKRARPWHAMSLLTRTIVPSPTPTMDVALTERARTRGLPIDHLETWEDQLAQLDAAVGIPDLVEAIAARDTMRCDLAANRASYVAGDLAAMERIYGGESARPLIVSRNERWLPAIERYLAGDGAFVAVGIGHLVGPAGLPAALERAGYTVDRSRPR
jgi:hypothetical protein